MQPANYIIDLVQDSMKLITNAVITEDNANKTVNDLIVAQSRFVRTMSDAVYDFSDYSANATMNLLNTRKKK